MGVTVHIEHEAEIDELIERYHIFHHIRDLPMPTDSKHCWNTNDSHWGYTDETTYEFTVMFIGKTGYGKSTTLNKLVGANVFKTSDVEVCTKDMYTSMYRIDSSIPSFLCLTDLPGVGESNYADNHYYNWYKEMLEMADVVVYVLRADQRDFAVDEQIFKNLFSKPKDRSKVILALNFADKVEPINRNTRLTAEQQKNLDKKIKEVSSIFNFSKENILYYSAADEINLNLLIKKIVYKICISVYKSEDVADSIISHMSSAQRDLPKFKKETYSFLHGSDREYAHQLIELLELKKTNRNSMPDDRWWTESYDDEIRDIEKQLETMLKRKTKQKGL